jgi:uncharacterized membrane protein YfcA
MLALTASILIFVPVKGDSEAPDINHLTYKRSRAVMASSGVGLLGGMVGQGGSFILIPLMTSFVQIPTRVAIGSNLAIVTLATFSGFLGKAYCGSNLSKKVSFVWLKRTLAVLIGFAAVRIWISILFN